MDMGGGGGGGVEEEGGEGGGEGGLSLERAPHISLPSPIILMGPPFVPPPPHLF